MPVGGNSRRRNIHFRLIYVFVCGGCGDCGGDSLSKIGHKNIFVVKLRPRIFMLSPCAVLVALRRRHADPLLLAVAIKYNRPPPHINYNQPFYGQPKMRKFYV